MAPHQVTKESRLRVKPETGKFYTPLDYADTTEAGKSPDVCVMLLRTEDMQSVHEVAAQLVKNRDGAAGPVVKLYERYATSFLGNLAAA